VDPISLGIGALGLGMQIFGGMGASSAAKAASLASQAEAGQEEQLNNIKQQQMTLSGNRQQMETFRNAQRARAQGLNAAVQGGSQYGSGIAGGQAQATDQAGYNNLGVRQNIQFGNQTLATDNTITGLKSQISQDQGTQASDQALAGIGGSLVKGAGTMSNIFGAAGNGIKSLNLGQGMFGGGSPSGF
jgi:hypothetical protein